MYKPLSTLNLSMETWEETIRPNFPSITPIFRCGWHHPTKSQKIPRKLPLIRLADWRSINFVQTVPFSIAWYDTNFPQRCWTPLVMSKTILAWRIPTYAQNHKSVKFGLNWSSKLQDSKNKRKNTIVAQYCVLSLSDAWEKLQDWSLSQIQIFK